MGIQKMSTLLDFIPLYLRLKWVWRVWVRWKKSKKFFFHQIFWNLIYNCFNQKKILASFFSLISDPGTIEPLGKKATLWLLKIFFTRFLKILFLSWSKKSRSKILIFQISVLTLKKCFSKIMNFFEVSVLKISIFQKKSQIFIKKGCY